jgi:LuxR family transcriptional regulator, maltose regulon positive regulatory protein
MDGSDQPEAARLGAAEPDQLLATKLHVPQPRPGFVPRPRLLERLAEGAARELTLVCTPAGFGKTTLLGDWARRGRQPVAWLSLDPGDNDPVRFWRYVVAALDLARAGLGARLVPLLRGSTSTSPEALITVLINLLATRPDQSTLVLDDYHLIEAPPVHQGLGLLLGRLPPQLRLVVASRADPPLQLARMRARGQLAELRAADLRFTVDESAALLRQTAGVDLPVDSLAALSARTEGWVAGLQLAALSLRGRADPAGFVATFSGSHRYVLDYLAEEVLERQPEQVREFLLETSVLTRLSGPLCDAVCGRADSQQLLEQIEGANLFLVPLDEARGWWRYHQLFADLLRVRLHQEQPDRPPVLHRAAAAWFEEQGLIDEAIRHALAAGAADWAARLVEDHFSTLLWRSENVTADRWLAALPPAVVGARPWLCLALAARAGLAGRLQEVEPLLEAAERAHATGSGGSPATPAGAAASLADDVPTMVAMVRANLARTYGDAGPATRLAERSLAGVAGDNEMAHAMIYWAQAQADWLGGRLAQAERTLTLVIAAYRAAGVPVQGAAIYYELGHVQQARGRLEATLSTCREALEIAAAIHPALPPAGAAHVRMADVLRERNELDAALGHATRGIELCRQLDYAWPLAAGLATLAWIQHGQGDQAGARQTMAEAEQVLPDPRLVELFNPAPARAARLALVQGRTADTARWVRDRGLGVDDALSYPREREYLVLARLLVAEQTADRALALLERLHAAADDQQRTGSVIEVRVVQALALRSSGDEAGALDALGEALALAWGEGYLRVFLDEGPPIASLLGRLTAAGRLARGVPVDYLRRLQEAFAQDGEAMAASSRRGAGADVPGLVQPLTGRELEVLELLAAGSANREIAEELVVTLDTVKKHVTHILDKLGAANRTQAVTRARGLGLIS